MSTHHAQALPSAAQDASASLNRLLFRKLMPLLIAAYVISFLDRTNIAFAKHSMGVDLGISSAAYGLGAGLFFLTYALFEIPSNLIMHRVGARFWITRIMITWGALSVAMAFVRGETSFYVMRLLLGAAEAGLFPGVMLYLTYWFGREQRARATGYFLLGVCIANVVGGPLAGALIELDGTLGFHGWQWLFVIEGIPAILLAFVVWTRLPDRPSAAPWLAPDTGRALERALAAEQDAGAASHGGHAFGAALRDPQIWLAIFVYFCHQLTIYTVIFFLPAIIGASGRLSPIAVGLLTALP
ncbi:MFS transporter, partial [Burkholderia multivorans]